jgi:hypothetical protein
MVGIPPPGIAMTVGILCASAVDEPSPNAEFVMRAP